MISTTSKVRHGLVHSDIHPRDKQNFSSCQKICHDDVLRVLKTLEDSLPNTKGMCVYLQLIRSVILAYHATTTPLTDRLYYAWLSTFICRIWRAWLDYQSKEKLDGQYRQQFSVLLKRLPAQLNEKIKRPNPGNKNTKRIFTITNPCLFSIEINAHSLTFLILLAIDGQLAFDALTIDLFSSQSCENLFRSARAMSGVSSNIVNFTASQFLRRSDKINALLSIKTEHENSSCDTSLRFPKHHKHGKASATTCSRPDLSHSSLQHADVERIVTKAYNTACDMFSSVLHGNTAKRGGIWTMKDLSESTAKHLNILQRRVRSSQKSSDKESEESDSDENDGQFDDGYSEHQGSDEEQTIDEVILDSSDTAFEGMRVKQSIDSSQMKSYFKVQREDGTGDMFLHKQTACWLLSSEKPFLSSDRLTRVTQGK